MTRRREGRWARFARGLLAEQSRLERPIVWLVLLSAADLLVTYTLLWQGASFYEANPIARWFFDRWNIAGMTFFKFGVIGGVVAVSEVVERQRRGWGLAVLLLGCAGTAAVVIHGLRLLLRHGSP